MQTISDRAFAFAGMALVLAAALACGSTREDPSKPSTTAAASVAPPIDSAAFAGPAPHDGYKMPAPPPQATWRPQNLPADLQALQAECDQGKQGSCVKLGDHLHAGSDVQEDPQLSAWLFYNACEKGEPTGCLYLGYAHLDGKGVDVKGGQAAAPVFARACNDKATAGCAGLGMLYMHGNGVPQDKARARWYFQRACGGGDEIACKMAKR
jgi:TPR repeat protein